MTKDPGSPELCPSTLAEMSRTHVRVTIAKTVAVLFTALALALGTLWAAWPARAARYYVPEARVGDPR